MKTKVPAGLLGTVRRSGATFFLPPGQGSLWLQSPFEQCLFREETWHHLFLLLLNASQVSYPVYYYPL